MTLCVLMNYVYKVRTISRTGTSTSSSDLISMTCDVLYITDTDRVRNNLRDTGPESIMGHNLLNLFFFSFAEKPQAGPVF